MDAFPQNAYFTPDSRQHTAMKTDEPLMFAHTAKLRTHAKPVMVLMSRAHNMTTTESVDTDSFVVKTKHVRETAQKMPIGRGTGWSRQFKKSSMFEKQSYTT